MERQYDYTYPSEPALIGPTPHNCHRYRGRTVIMTAATKVRRVGCTPLHDPSPTPHTAHPPVSHPKGLGYATAIRIAEEGANLVISSRKMAAVDEAVAALRTRGLEVRGMVCHQAKADHRAAIIDFTVRTFGKIDAVILCAGVQPGPATQDSTLDVDGALFDKARAAGARRGGGCGRAAARLGGGRG